MEQSRIESVIETIINVGSGWLIALLLWSFAVGPLWGFESTMADNFAITGLFTIVSVTRSYFWRRFFNAELHKLIHKTVGEFFNGR